MFYFSHIFYKYTFIFFLFSVAQRDKILILIGKRIIRVNIFYSIS